jgi:hypothetical protein
MPFPELMDRVSASYALPLDTTHSNGMDVDDTTEEKVYIPVLAKSPIPVVVMVSENVQLAVG